MKFSQGKANLTLESFDLGVLPDILKFLQPEPIAPQGEFFNLSSSHETGGWKGLKFESNSQTITNSDSRFSQIVLTVAQMEEKQITFSNLGTLAQGDISLEFRDSTSGAFIVSVFLLAGEEFISLDQVDVSVDAQVAIWIQSSEIPQGFTFIIEDEEQVIF